MPDLVPVENDPFSVNLQPIEYDPFGIQPYVPPAAQSEAMGKVVSGLSKQAGDVVGGALTLPGNVAAGRIDPLSDEGIGRAADLAGMMTLGAGAAPAERDALGMGIRAFHGSPYDFEKFDLGKIGTGEGAQAYGHGLYFAENPATAEAYKKALTGLNPNQLGSGKAEFGVNDVPMPSGISGHAALDTGQEMSLLLGTMKNHPDSTMIPYLKQNIERRIANNYAMTGEGSAGDDMRAMAKYYDEHVKNAKPEDVSHIAPGRTYEVNINADPEHFLDWDKPLSEQSPKVQDAVRAAHEKATGFTNIAPYVSGEDITDKLGLALHTPNAGHLDKAAAAQALHEAGIPGIKYLDQGSRGSGEGTSNYVVFNDKLIDIIKKYGLAGLVAGGAAHFKTTPVEHDPFAQ